MPILIILFTGSKGGGSSSPQKGSVVGMEGDNSTSEPGGVMEVTMLGFHV